MPNAREARRAAQTRRKCKQTRMQTDATVEQQQPAGAPSAQSARNKKEPRVNTKKALTSTTRARSHESSRNEAMISLEFKEITGRRRKSKSKHEVLEVLCSHNKHHCVPLCHIMSHCAFVYQKDNSTCQSSATNLCKLNNTRYCLDHYRMVQKKLSAERRAVDKQQSEEYSKKAKLYEELVNKTAPSPVPVGATTTVSTIVAPIVVSSEFEALKGGCCCFGFVCLTAQQFQFFLAELHRLSQRVEVLEQQQLTRASSSTVDFWNH